jgi:hypothetical protein
VSKDYFYDVCEIPKDENDNVIDDVSVAREKIAAVVSRMSTQHLDRALDVIGYFEEPEDARATLTETLTDSYEYLLSADDAEMLAIKGSLFWVSGGGSYGDDPTEAIKHIWNLNILEEGWWK